MIVLWQGGNRDTDRATRLAHWDQTRGGVTLRELVLFWPEDKVLALVIQKEEEFAGNDGRLMEGGIVDTDDLEQWVEGRGVPKTEEIKKILPEDEFW